MPARAPKTVEGIKFVPELESLCQKILTLSVSSSSNDDKSNRVETDAVKKALTPMSITEAKDTIEKIDWKDVKKHSTFPLIAVKALKSLIAQSSNSDLLLELESIISKTSLSFTKSTTDLNEIDEERKKYLERIRLLKLRKEERQYSKLTKNIDKKPTEDAGTKTMTYAASVGLNMIVAPLSFGCLCYFFSAGIFSWIDGRIGRKPANDNIDIRRVILGVIAGVIMMFIEMILFVIRSHTLEKSLTIKERKKDITPFGFDRNSKHHERTFTGSVYS